MAPISGPTLPTGWLGRLWRGLWLPMTPRRSLSGSRAEPTGGRPGYAAERVVWCLSGMPSMTGGSAARSATCKGRRWSGSAIALAVSRGITTTASSAGRSSWTPIFRRLIAGGWLTTRTSLSRVIRPPLSTSTARTTTGSASHALTISPSAFSGGSCHQATDRRPALVSVVGEDAQALAGEQRVEHVQEALAVVVV